MAKQKLNYPERLCPFCAYSLYDENAYDYAMCAYILKTGHMRGCPVVGCNKFVDKMTVQKKRKRVF